MVTLPDIGVSIEALCRTGTIIKYTPTLDPDQPVFRAVYLTPEAKEWLDGKTRTVAGSRAPQLGLRRVLNQFCAGRWMPDGKRGLLHPVTLQEIDKNAYRAWELRNIEEEHSRAIGVFLKFDYFLIHTCAPKSWFVEDTKDDRYAAEAKKALAFFSSQFPGRDPQPGKRVDQVIQAYPRASRP